MDELVSIIIPVYNAEKTISKCIESVRNQSYENIEIIIIDDGSNDNSLKICESLSDIDDRIHVVGIENLGVSYARNIGLDYAHGKYIQFVDSDDYIEKDMVDYMVRTMQKDNVDIVVCGYNCISNNKITPYCLDQKYNKASFGADKNMSLKLFDISFYNACWNKLYRKSLITEKFDNKYIIGEDLLFNLNYFNNCASFSAVDKAFYNYISQDNNSMHKIDKTKLYQQIDICSKGINWFTMKGYDAEVIALWKQICINMLLNLVQLYILSDDKYKTKRMTIRDIFSKLEIKKMMSELNFVGIDLKITSKLCTIKSMFLLQIYVKTKNMLRRIKRKIKRQ